MKSEKLVLLIQAQRILSTNFHRSNIQYYTLRILYSTIEPCVSRDDFKNIRMEPSSDSGTFDFKPEEVPRSHDNLARLLISVTNKSYDLHRDLLDPDYDGNPNEIGNIGSIANILRDVLEIVTLWGELVDRLSLEDSYRALINFSHKVRQYLADLGKAHCSLHIGRHYKPGDFLFLLHIPFVIFIEARGPKQDPDHTTILLGEYLCHRPILDPYLTKEYHKRVGPEYDRDSNNLHRGYCAIHSIPLEETTLENSQYPVFRQIREASFRVLNLSRNLLQGGRLRDRCRRGEDLSIHMSSSWLYPKHEVIPQKYRGTWHPDDIESCMLKERRIEGAILAEPIRYDEEDFRRHPDLPLPDYRGKRLTRCWGPFENVARLNQQEIYSESLNLKSFTEFDEQPTIKRGISSNPYCHSYHFGIFKYHIGEYKGEGSAHFTQNNGLLSSIQAYPTKKKDGHLDWAYWGPERDCPLIITTPIRSVHPNPILKIVEFVEPFINIKPNQYATRATQGRVAVSYLPNFYWPASERHWTFPSYRREVTQGVCRSERFDPSIVGLYISTSKSAGHVVSRKALLEKLTDNSSFFSPTSLVWYIHYYEETICELLRARIQERIGHQEFSTPLRPFSIQLQTFCEEFLAKLGYIHPVEIHETNPDGMVRRISNDSPLQYIAPPKV